MYYSCEVAFVVEDLAGNKYTDFYSDFCYPDEKSEVRKGEESIALLSRIGIWFILIHAVETYLSFLKKIFQNLNSSKNVFKVSPFLCC